MSTSLLKASLALVCLFASARMAAAQTFGGRRGQKPPHLFQVRDERGHFGFIDRTGRLVIGFDTLPPLAQIEDFSEGLLAVCVPDPKSGYCAEYGHGYIDETGKFAIPPRFRYAGSFSEGLAFVHLNPEEGGGFINRRGEFVIRTKDGYAQSPFREGLSLMHVGRDTEFIDHSGKAVVSGYYGFVEPFSEGLAAFAQGAGRAARYGFINMEGKVVIEPRFEPEFEHHGFVVATSGFSEDLACVKVNGMYGFINKKGEMVLPPVFHNRATFHEGLACIDGEKFIDKKGRRVFGRRFAGCGDFAEGLATVSVKTSDGVKLGYINRRGKLVVKPRFFNVYPFLGGLAVVYEAVGPERDTYGQPKKSFWGYIDRTGRYVWRQP